MEVFGGGVSWSYRSVAAKALVASSVSVPTSAIKNLV